MNKKKGRKKRNENEYGGISGLSSRSLSHFKKLGTDGDNITS